MEELNDDSSIHALIKAFLRRAYAWISPALDRVIAAVLLTNATTVVCSWFADCSYARSEKPL